MPGRIDHVGRIENPLLRHRERQFRDDGVRFAGECIVNSRYTGSNQTKPIGARAASTLTPTNNSAATGHQRPYIQKISELTPRQIQRARRPSTTRPRRCAAARGRPGTAGSPHAGAGRTAMRGANDTAAQPAPVMAHILKRASRVLARSQQARTTSAEAKHARKRVRRRLGHERVTPGAEVDPGRRRQVVSPAGQPRLHPQLRAKPIASCTFQVPARVGDRTAAWRSPPAVSQLDERRTLKVRRQSRTRASTAKISVQHSEDEHIHRRERLRHECGRRARWRSATAGTPGTCSSANSITAKNSTCRNWRCVSFTWENALNAASDPPMGPALQLPVQRMNQQAEEPSGQHQTGQQRDVVGQHRASPRARELARRSRPATASLPSRPA